MNAAPEVQERGDTERVGALRRRVRDAMERPPVAWERPPRTEDRYIGEPRCPCARHAP